MSIQSLVIFAASLLSLTGCVVWPHTSTIVPPVRGMVVDNATGQPVAGAHVTHQFRDKLSKAAKTDALGRFHIAPLKQFHWGYSIGIALNHDLPHPFTGCSARGADVESRLVVERPSYVPCDVSLSRQRYGEPPHDDYQQPVTILLVPITQTTSIQGASL